MMTQPQDATQLVSGMAAAPPSRLSVVPGFFANLLQDMLPQTQGGADPAELMLSQALTEKGAASVKGNTGILPASGRVRGNDKALTGNWPDADGSRLAPLLILAGQLPAGQDQALPAGELESATLDILPTEGRNTSPDQTEEASGFPTIPFLNMAGGMPQLPLAPGATETPLVSERATALGMAQKEPKPSSLNGCVLPESAAHETLDVSALLDQTRSPAQRDAVSTVMTAVAETAPALMRVPTPAAEGTKNQPGQQPGQTAALQPHQRSNQAVEAPQTTTAIFPREGGTQAPHSGVQLPLMPTAGLSHGAESMLATTPSGEARAITHASLAERIGGAENLSRFSGVNPSLQEGSSTRTLPDLGGSSGSPSTPIVEVLFSDPATRERSSSGKEGNGAGSKQNEQDGGTGFAVPGARTTDMPLSNRFTLQPKVEETRNALHGSILEQVTASVVSHDSKGNGTMTVRLNPHELGEVQVNVRIENQHVKVEIVTANQTVREALMGNLENLKETFLKQNLTMERFDVSSGAGNGFGQGFREERDGQRPIAPLPFGQEVAPFGIARESGDDWGETENLLVNLRL